MYETLKRLYDEGKLTEKGIRNAVKRGWITQEQAEEILAKPEESAPPPTQPETEDDAHQNGA